MRHASTACCSVLVAAAAFCACAHGGGPDGSSFGDDAGTPSEAAVPSLDADLDRWLLGSHETAAEGASCSSDLRDVLDASGNVVASCPVDQGCEAGRCVPACTAAGDSHGNVGCDFRVATPSFFADYSMNGYYSPCFAVVLANRWARPAHVDVERAGKAYDVTRFGRIPVDGAAEAAWPAVPATGIPPGQVAVLFLEVSANSIFQCGSTSPVETATTSGTAVMGTGRGVAWHLTTDTPVSAYDILPYGGAESLLPSTELLFPTTAWGTNYIAVVAKIASGANASRPGPQWGQVMATQDGTVVQVVPTVPLPAGTDVAPAPQNAVTEYRLAAGEFVQWQNDYSYTGGGAAPMEMSGTILSSNHPIAFMGGNGYLCLGSASSQGGGCDSGHQQIAPVTALGSEYAPAPYTTRRADLAEESVPYRIVGAANGTTLVYEPPVAGAPTTLKIGQWADFEATGAFVVKSQDAQHPFYLSQMMTGCQVTGGSRPAGSTNCIGDEEFVDVMPPAQFLSSYVFFTDPTYPTTTFTLVRRRSETGFQDVTIDCLPGPLSGWSPVGAGGTYEWTTVDLVRDGVGTGSCTTGPHAASSKGPFGLTVWGIDTFASYGYPVGTSLAAINSVVVPPMPQ